VLAILTNIDTQTSALSNTSSWSTLATVYSNAAQQLQALSYPANAQADAKAMVAILNKLAADAELVPTAGESDLLNDVGTGHADSDALRNDLGLPSAPISG
jgi:hypothetical protein